MGEPRIGAQNRENLVRGNLGGGALSGRTQDERDLDWGWRGEKEGVERGWESRGSHMGGQEWGQVGARELSIIAE